MIEVLEAVGALAAVCTIPVAVVTLVIYLTWRMSE